MPLWRLMPLLLCILLPLPGFAQSALELDQEDPYGGYDDETEGDETKDGAPRDELIPREGSFLGEGRREGPRLIAESLLGLTLGLVGVAPGAYLGFVLAASEDSSGSYGILEVAGLGFLGVTVGATLGVYAGGSLMDGEGRLGMTLVGAVLGALTGALLAVPAAFVVDEGWIVPVLALPVVGAIIAYESTHAREQERRAAVAGTRITMVPVISVRPSGGLVAGLAGCF